MRIEFIEIEGKKYPLSFSLSASEQIMKKYNNPQKMVNILQNKNVNIHVKINIICNILESLIYSGCQYYNAFNKEKYENAPIKNGKFIGLTCEQIKVSLPLDEEYIENLTSKIKKCIESSNTKQLGTKPIKNNSKKKRKKSRATH